MRCRLRRLSNLVGFVVALIVVADAHAQPVKPRISVMVDSSGSMLLTPEIVTPTRPASRRAGTRATTA
jgi:hypothetical protein